MEWKVLAKQLNNLKDKFEKSYKCINIKAEPQLSSREKFLYFLAIIAGLFYIKIILEDMLNIRIFAETIIEMSVKRLVKRINIIDQLFPSKIDLVIGGEPTSIHQLESIYVSTYKWTISPLNGYTDEEKKILSALPNIIVQCIQQYDNYLEEMRTVIYVNKD